MVDFRLFIDLDGNMRLSDYASGIDYTFYQDTWMKWVYDDEGQLVVTRETPPCSYLLIDPELVDSLPNQRWIQGYESIAGFVSVTLDWDE